MRGAHRISYQIHKGRIPPAKEVDHTCNNRKCVNPTHLQLLTHRENVLKGRSPSARAARKERCDQCGGELTQGKRQRFCKPCLKIYRAKYYQANKMPIRRSDLPAGMYERFMSHVRDTGDCWLWQGAKTKDGYGVANIGVVTPRGTRKVLSTHRLSYLLHHGDIPDGLFVMHSCDVKLCVNPKHLRTGTRTENLHDAMAKGRVRFSRRTGEPRTKLSPERVREIRRLLQSNLFSLDDIARRYRVAPKTIMNIRDGVSHKHV